MNTYIVQFDEKREGKDVPALMYDETWKIVDSMGGSVLHKMTTAVVPGLVINLPEKVVGDFTSKVMDMGSSKGVKVNVEKDQKVHANAKEEK
ncbi:uncharacterized protein KNAG_0H03740 [Huiozyma naganishii CBS 8797]|uniref:Uncharacterized protein n=1 Tax=Huiozyma naganishii (strain ATCC MYA-139 / BCRC 22969 / CBS 8797 / KCTC 17520 / NBRC 10181 / NCYC 3082 / Yp74L-3) TaxID=1071383 RepID=J7RPV6_HUIN7|nr:hypothetical protein KNAG_0H03740 [Kazachstania naganishii CBS 8797]CCK71788.1 hypothetical protein KNAG_0H03740 [Kazachstania naganishii CBS 8797]